MGHSFAGTKSDSILMTNGKTSAATSPNQKVSDYFGCNVFGPQTMKLLLPKETYRKVQDAVNEGKRFDTTIKPYDSKPIVGSTAYKHKAGTHLAAILRNPAAYEPIEPKVVGNRRRIVFGELAGKNGAAYLMSLLGLDQNDEHAKAVAAGLKNLRMGDLLEIPLDDRLEKKIINDTQIKVKSGK
jgi:hypothetical protein